MLLAILSIQSKYKQRVHCTLKSSETELCSNSTNIVVELSLCDENHSLIIKCSAIIIMGANWNEKFFNGYVLVMIVCCAPACWWSSVEWHHKVTHTYNHILLTWEDCVIIGTGCCDQNRHMSVKRRVHYFYVRLEIMIAWYMWHAIIVCCVWDIWLVLRIVWVSNFSYQANQSNDHHTELKACWYCYLLSEHKISQHHILCNYCVGNKRNLIFQTF